MSNPWRKIDSAPKDGSYILLASVDEDGSFGVRMGFYERGPADRCWYDIDGENIEPQFWMELPTPPGAVL